MAGKEINMIMVGPSRVGKSSLLTTMYREIRKMEAGFSLSPDDETSDRLEEAFQKLERVKDQPVFAPMGEDLLKMTAGFVEHRFDVFFGAAKEFDLVFQDIRGGSMKKRTEPEWKELEEKVAGSHVVFNVLDAVALMETNEARSDALNGHTRVCELLERTLATNKKCLILFVLVKCESYVNTADGRKRLEDKFEKRHAAVLRLIERLDQTSKNVVALLIPAETLGCVQFKEIDAEGNFRFERIRKDFEWRDVDQPLRFALSFVLKCVQEDRDMLTWLWDFLTGKAGKFTKALEDFCKGRKDGYKKYGNPKLL